MYSKDVYLVGFSTNNYIYNYNLIELYIHMTMYTYIDIYVCVCVSVTKPSLSPLRLDENASSYSEHVYKAWIWNKC